MSSFDWRKNIEDSIKNGLIITIGVAGIFFGLKVANVKPPKASLDAMDILKLTGGICGGMLVKDYAVYKNGSTSDTTKKFITLYRVIKINATRLNFADLLVKVTIALILSHNHQGLTTFQWLKCRWDW